MSREDKRKSFWMVWCEGGDAPTRKHASLASADQESERLARANRGQTFVVLRSVSECVVDDVRRIEHEDEDDVPF